MCNQINPIFVGLTWHETVDHKKNLLSLIHALFYVLFLTILIKLYIYFKVNLKIILKEFDFFVFAIKILIIIQQISK